MVYLLAPQSSSLQMGTTKFQQEYVAGSFVIDTMLDSTHYKLRD